MDTQSKLYEDADEIDLLELCYMLLRHVKLLAACLLAGAVLAGVVTKFLITPIYTASSQIYIFTKTTSVTSLADLQIGTQLASDFEILGTSRPVIERVIRDLRLDTTYEQLLQTITVNNLSNSRILEITVENPDPQLACDISNAMAESLSLRVAEIMNTDQPSIVADAVVPAKPSSPSLKRNVLLGALLGFVLCAGVLVVKFLLDDTIKTAEDVEKYLRINTLAAIPLEHGQEPSRKALWGRPGKRPSLPAGKGSKASAAPAAPAASASAAEGASPRALKTKSAHIKK